MLKKYLFGLALMGALTGCSDDYDDWSMPQANGPEESKNVTIEVTPAASIDLATVEGDSVVVLTPALVAEEGAKVSYRLEITNEAKDQKGELEADEQGRVAVADLSAAVVKFYGKRPTERILWATVSAYVDVNGQVVKKTVKEPVAIKAVPVAPVIEESYYLVGDGIGWDLAGALAHPFKHSSKDVYDDPVFSITVPAPFDEEGNRTDFHFKVVPASGLGESDLVWGVVLGTDLEGVDGDDRYEAGMKANGGSFLQYGSDEAQFYNIRLNMMDGKLYIEAVGYVSWIYMPGNPQGWNPATAPALHSPASDGIYSGYGYLDGEFKFTKGTDWSDGEYASGTFFTYEEGGFMAADETNPGSNIKWTGTPGYYKIDADVANGSLFAEPVAWGIIGPAQPGGWDADTDMTYNKEEDCWEATLDLKADELKFRANDDWAINFGGALDNLSEGGNNIKLGEAGNYTVKLYLSCSHGQTVRYATLTKN